MAAGKPEFVGGVGGPPRLPVIRMGAGAGCLAMVLLIAALLGGLYFAFLDYVGPNEYGIMEVQMGINRGIQPEVYPPGYSLVIPFAQIMHKLPRQVQVLELTQLNADTKPHTAALESESVHHDAPAKIQTSDGFYVDVDVSFLYRITDAHKAFLEYGGGQGYLLAGVLPRAEPVLKQALGELTTEEFYQAPLRVERTEAAKALLNQELNDHGIVVEQVLVRYFKYTDRIQQNIEEKKLQDQLVFTNQSKRKAAEAEQSLRRVETEGQAQVLVTLEEGKAYQVKKEAEKDLYVRAREAEANLLVELAEAERSRLRNEALQQLGSDRYVAMEMADVLQGLEFIVLPVGGENDVNPLELDSLLDVFGVNVGADVAVPPAAATTNPRIEQLFKGAEEAVEAGKQVSAEPPPDFLAEPTLESEDVTEEDAQ
ncbi:MAG: hypothetical protein RLZZ303_3761 [Candidatus Hydrogenedentota bacterium]|jgi:regulator of protease activity HflC (stomatin/prohibitin superfamily)